LNACAKGFFRLRNSPTKRKVTGMKKALAVALCVVITSLTLPLGALLPAPAHAARDHYTVPLVVIRFNQQRVHYERPLFNAISKALNTKEDARFNVIYYHITGNERLQKRSDDSFKEVLANLADMGIPRSRIGVKKQPSPELGYSEVHIYVY